MFTLTLSSYFGRPGGPGENWLHSKVDICENNVSADQYHLTHPGRVFLEVIRWQVTSFQMIAGSSLFFITLKIHLKYVVFMSLWPRTINILSSNWPRTQKSCQLGKNTSREDRCFSEPAGHIGDFGNFLNGFIKSPSVVRWSWILNECNLCWKIVQNCILSEVCMMKTPPHSTSDVMYKKHKRLVYTHPDLLARFCKVNLSNAKNSAWFVFQA